MKTIVILAGGKGSRLGDLTKDIPKPMVDVHGKPFLDWLIQHYIAQGFNDIVISTGYKSEVIENYAWPIVTTIIKDNQIESYKELFGSKSHIEMALPCRRWIVNGDTFIPESLPMVKELTILSCNEIDAGAQYNGYSGKIHIHPVKEFFDIGTPFGLGTFRAYFKNHPLYIKSLRNNL